MDFSTPKLALLGLKRRHGALHPHLTGLVDTLLEASCLACFQQQQQQQQGGGREGQPQQAVPEAVEETVGKLLTDELWESIAVGLLLAQCLLSSPTMKTSSPFEKSLVPLADEHLEHSEPRVRTLVVDVLAALAREADRRAGGPDNSTKGGLAVYYQFKERITGSIAGNWKRETEVIADAIKGAQDVAVDDTTGWKALETSLLALKGFVDAIGRPFLEGGHLTEELRGFVTAGATKHVNRHVREAAFKIIAAILNVGGPLEGRAEGEGEEGGGVAPLADASALEEIFVPAIVSGLQDNWSQVRFAASVANRALLSAISEESRSQHYSVLLPRMCLNRYYLAEGVKLYSQETWQMFMGDNGRFVVAKYAAEVAEYYTTISDADNHVVREAACHSIAEMAVKVPHEAVAPHVAKLLDALLLCFYDESWPVRDAACVASGRFAAAYSDECRPQLERLYERWLHHLSDPIWSVREDSAVALGAVCKAYGSEAVERVMAWLKESLPRAREQAAQTAEEAKAVQNDPKTHTDTQRYSCGSLAPKLKKGAKVKKGGCSDCEVSRASLPWEFSDGALYMIKELCGVGGEVQEQAISLFPEAVAVCSLTHFPQADSLRETLWKQLPAMAHALGKKVFKRHLDLFLECLFDTLQRPGTHQLARHAAGACVGELSAFVGPGIFRGRLSEEQQDIMDQSHLCRSPGAGMGMSEHVAMQMSMGLPGPPARASA